MVAATCAQAAPPRRSFLLPETVVGAPAVDGDALFYRHGERLRRVDLVTLQRTSLYRRRGLDSVRAGGGRVAFDFGGLRSGVLEPNANGGKPAVLANGRLRAGRRICGTEVSLADVSSEGSLLVDAARLGCGRRSRIRHRLIRYGGGPALTIHRFTERRDDDSADWRLAGQRLLGWSERRASVRDLTTRGVRTIRPLQRHYEFASADIDADGHLATAEIRYFRRSSRALVRVDGQLLADLPDVNVEARFCGGRLVEHRIGRTVEELLVHDVPNGPGRVALSVPRPPNLAGEFACDADTAVVAARRAIDVVPLAP
jgi:hypothetical protein